MTSFPRIRPQRRGPEEGYTRLQAPGLPGIYLRDLPLTLAGRTLRVYSASATDILAEPGRWENPYWSVAWPAGLALARYLAEHDLRNKRVLELGSGVGVSSLGAAVAGADVLATDNVPSALKLAAMNARRNGLTLRTAAADWRAWPLRQQFNLVIASDVTYFPEGFNALLEVVRVSRAPGGRVWITDPGRTATGAFIQRAEEQGWQVERLLLPSAGAHSIQLLDLFPGGT